MNEKKRMVSGALYLSSDKKLKAERKKTQKLLRQFNKLLPYQNYKRYKLIHKIFRNAGKKCSVYPPFYCDYGYNIQVGNYFFSNINCVILDITTVTIGNHVMLGPNVTIITATHPTDSRLRNQGFGFGRSVIIGDNVWIGANAIVNPGVQIGNNTIIGSGSVVTGTIPPNVVAAGNPCKILYSIANHDSL